MSNLFIFDSEGDGLLDEITKFHCWVFKEHKQDNWFVFTNRPLTDEEKANFSDLSITYASLKHLSAFLDRKAEAIVCHNMAGFDLPAAVKLGLIEDYDFIEQTINNKPIQLIDSLAWSRCLHPERMLPVGCPKRIKNPVTGKMQTVGAHGLQAWGYRVANMKPNIDDWRNQPLVTYLHRCIEDVKINEKVYDVLVKEKSDVAKSSTKGWDEALYESQTDFGLFCIQERTGVPFNREAAEKLVKVIDKEMDTLNKEVQQFLGERPLPKGKQPKPPVRAFKKDGSLSKDGLNYGVKLGITDTTKLERLLEDIGRGIARPPVLMEQITLAHQEEVKVWLLKEGWIPTIFGTKDCSRDEFKRNLPEDKVEEKIAEYVEKMKVSPFRYYIEKEIGVKFDHSLTHLFKKLKRQARFLPSTIKLKDERGELCPNLDKIRSADAKKIVKWLSLRNRRTVLKGYDESKPTGWLNNPRLDIDGRLSQGSSGLTPTNRHKHREVVNVPSCDALLGKEMRSLFIASEGYDYVGWDASAIENRVAGHFTYPYDNGEYAHSLLQGDSHEQNALAYSEAAGFEISRGQGKGITYCLPKDRTQVLTRRGYRYFKDIEPTDYVLTKSIYGDNLYQRIQHITEMEASELYYIIFQNGVEAVCTAEHRWRVYGGAYKYTTELKHDTPIDIGNTIKLVDRVLKVQEPSEVFCLTTANGNFYIKQDGETGYKGLTGNCILYGGAAPKVAKMIGVDNSVGERVRDAFWNTNQGLKKLKDRVEAYWESTGKKYILGVDGRKIYTRSKHALLNSLFQSTGALLVSRALRIYYQMLKEEGWFEKGYERLTYTHDEAQNQLPKGYTEEFVFDTKDEAEDFVYEGKILANAQSKRGKRSVEKDGKYYRYYNRVGELGCLALLKSGEELGMRLPIEGEYKVGTNWAETH